MVVEDIVRYVDQVKPSPFNEYVQIGWIEELESLIDTEIFDGDGCIGGLSLNDELSIDKPHCRMYSLYIFMMIDLLMENYDAYRASREEFDRAYELYAKWHLRRRGRAARR